ncbi:MAG TPA: Asp-tRNA(Asn)/Glu-tRNA(Gln) amidotransferase subunit GatA [Candidatus Atribacteria bacterium]|nr:Asp-tRNA(Asn)/Glu-tRNA(Gln) amidotransferase subunit GatA [Candidatus Atribacteria bacterium]
MELYKLTIHEAARLLDRREISYTELTESIIGRITDVEDRIGAFITLDVDRALDHARSLDKLGLARNEKTALTGIPYGLKDNICTSGMKTTCASKMLANFVPCYDATVFEKLKAMNSILLGKLNLDSFAIGSSGETSYYMRTANPWDAEKVPGGSSSGSAAAVAADEVLFSLGTDTGGSIRQPAAFCGIVGMKPTYGLVSRYGLIAFASSLDQIGPLTKDVSDCALVLSAIAGHDEKDSTSVNKPSTDYSTYLVDDIKGLRIALPQEYFDSCQSPEVRMQVIKAARIFESMGAVVEEVSLPLSEYSVPVYFLLSSAEGASNLARFDGIRYGYRADDADGPEGLYCRSRTEGFGENVKRRIMLGNLALEPGRFKNYYLKAARLRTLIKQELDNVLEKYDVILSPTTTETAFKFGVIRDNTLDKYKQDICIVPANLAGLPAISIPCGFNSSGMPIGMQLMGKAFSEGLLLRAAYTFEQNTDYHTKRPTLLRGDTNGS